MQTLQEYPIAELRDYIDWHRLLHRLGDEGHASPTSSTTRRTGEAARELYDDAQEMLDKIIEEKRIEARGVYGLFPANSTGEDVVVYADDSRTEERATLFQLRQQGQHRDGISNKSMADFVAPVGEGADHVGAFAVTAGIGLPDRVKAFKDDLDDYSAILLEALADRLAEAFAERLHERVRTEFWGYAPTRAATGSSPTRT